MNKVVLYNANVSEAMAQVEMSEILSPKNLSCLRLLTEEMYSMLAELLDKSKADYSFEINGNKALLSVSVQMWADDETKEAFLSMSSSGKNAAYKGVRGFFRSVIDALATGDSYVYYADFAYGFSHSEVMTTRVWSLSQYMGNAPKEKVKKEWDGLERSIIVNFADDVSVGIHDGNINITVIKKL